LNTSTLDEKFLLARKRDVLKIRADLIQNIRLFFIKQGFLEVETPLRIPAPAPEEHIEALHSGDWFLQTSPELCMKRLLAAGYPQIFQICKCFRAAERGRRHLPEFTILEWYVAGFDYHQLMDQCAEMIVAVAAKPFFDHCFSRQKHQISLALPWEKITVEEAFIKHAPVTLAEALNKNKFDEILVEYVEPHLGTGKPTFMYDYPARMAALAKLKEGNPNVAQRFELYIGGVELANGFSELTDAGEQRRRFEEARKHRAKRNYAAYPLPEKFLSALADMPASAGIALGIDRLVMLFAETTNIDDVVSFPPEIL
jgi:elongation factor P--(R)-beta-lysine ligase